MPFVEAGKTSGWLQAHHNKWKGVSLAKDVPVHLSTQPEEYRRALQARSGRSCGTWGHLGQNIVQIWNCFGRKESRQQCPDCQRRNHRWQQLPAPERAREEDAQEILCKKGPGGPIEPPWGDLPKKLERVVEDFSGGGGADSM